uniref:Guanylate cyclase n=1 Tax=Saccoglossus kowalevskii TaxID=10224 RepID=A0ABM0MIS4_SACKO|nr:PREDICTED: atrial natriuretic peptide receptor 1-like [Saccoglossus kowalevskii]
MAVYQAFSDRLLRCVVWVLANCNPRIGTGMVVDLRYIENVDFFVGAPCSLVAIPTGHLASYWNLPFVAWVSRDPKLADKEEFTTSARIMGPLNKVSKLCAQIFNQFGWRLGVMVYSESVDFCVYATTAVQTSFRANNISLGDTIKLRDQMSSEEMTEAFLKIRQRGRIVIFCTTNLNNERKFMLFAHEQGMTGGDYVFINLNQLFTDIRTPQNPWEMGDDRDVDAYYAYESVLTLEMATVSNEEIDEFLDLIPIKMAEPPFNYTLAPGIRGNIYSPFLHDAVFMYAIALNKTLEQGGHPRDGEKWFSNVKGLTFHGMTGNVVMDENGDREPDYWVLDLRPSGHMEVVAESINGPNGERIFRMSHLPIWGRNGNGAILKTPSDRPACGFLGEHCNETDNSVLIATVTVAVVVILCGAIAAVLVYRVRFQSMTTSLWQIKSEEVQVFQRLQATLGSLHSKSSAAEALDQQDKTFTVVGSYQGIMCAIRYLKIENHNPTNENIEELKTMRNLSHENINKFYGACFEQSHNFLLTAYCPKGSLSDILNNEDIKLDWMFKISFIADLIEGIAFLHKTILGSHGYLKSTNCVVDKKWVLKITDYGYCKYRAKAGDYVTGIEDRSASMAFNENSDKIWSQHLWTAPELLRDLNRPVNGTHRGDIYSFGMILQEIVQRRGPFPTEKYMFYKDIVNRVRSGETPPFRPDISPMLSEPEITDMMHISLSEVPELRPCCDNIRRRLYQLNNGQKPNVLDNLLQKMEKYADNLEELVNARTQELVDEKKKTDMLLYRMLPPSVAEQLKSGQQVHPETYDQVSIFFSDIVGFTVISSHSTPMQVVDLLNDLYTLFDEIIQRFDVYKVETIGDAYMVVSGLPNRNGFRHASEVANMSLVMLREISNFKIPHMPGDTLQLRIGIHTGPCAAGVVGLSMPRFCLFGDTVNVASRMESTGEALKIHCSKWTYNVLGYTGGYRWKERGDVEVQGKGKILTYWLLGRDTPYEKSNDQSSSDCKLSPPSHRDTPLGSQNADNINH